MQKFDMLYIHYLLIDIALAFISLDIFAALKQIELVIYLLVISLEKIVEL